MTSWKPSGPTAFFGVGNNGEMMLYAAPIAGGAAVALARVRNISGFAVGNAPFSVRSDATLIALSIADSATTRRISVFDLTTGRARWLTTPAAGETDWVPVWAADGTLYVARSGAAGDVGVLHFTLDGSVLPPIAGPADFYGAFTSVSRVTADGTLIGADQFNGPTAWVLDLASGKKRSFGIHYSYVTGWRATRPRALVSVTTNLAAPGGGYLSLWDDVTDVKTQILGLPIAGADFAPDGRQIVVAAPEQLGEDTRLVTMSLDGTAQRVISGTASARDPLWIADGIAYSTYTPAGPNEVRVTSPDGKSSRILYSTVGQIQRLQVVAAPRSLP